MRARKGMALEELSQVTRIGKRHLAALEAEDFSELPAPVFVKGFLRSYCEALREAPDEALALYREIQRAAVPARPTPSPRRLLPRTRRRSPVRAAVLLLVLAGGLGVVLLAFRGGSVPRSSDAPVPGVDSTERVSPAPTEDRATPAEASGIRAGPEVSARAGPPVAAGAGRTSAGGQRLVARTTEPTWVRVQMDSADPVQELLPAGATREWTAEARFVLTIGNAGGIELELNGRPVPALGERGAVIRDLVLPGGPVPRGGS